MKKICCKSFLVLLCLVFLCIPASAHSETVDISITYCGISITLNGEALSPADADLNPVEPFIYNGTTYLPVRGLALALGLNVNWDSNTNTVNLTSGGTKSCAASFLSTYTVVETRATYCDIKITLNGEILHIANAQGESVEPFIIDGTTYLPLRAVAAALGLSVEWNGETNSISLSSENFEYSTAPDASVSGRLTVYITRTGKRYHYNGNCNGGIYYESTLEHALALGLTPCEKCVG